ncbi:ribonuclease HI family protein [Candidatus Kaiserbacteria bacterium]|nr:ribonuclease HI family protein [Candidatus Kaiserbacteria bacterium]
MKKIIAYTDGGARGNPGPAGLGVHIENEDGDVLKEVSQYLGEQTNNFAEYAGALVALETLRELYGDDTPHMQFEIKLDSELVQKQINGEYKVKSDTLRPIYEEIIRIRDEYFPHITFTHVRREYNKDADRLANEAMDRGA